MANQLTVDPSKAKFGRHGDLKPENILWFENLDPAGVLQITDFGLGRFHRLESRSKQDPKYIYGSPTYSPPELMLKKDVTREYDIWSLGCIFLEFIMWIIDGSNRLESFARSRLAKAFDNIVDDTYYMLIISSSGRSVKVQEGVTTWIKKLSYNLRCSAIVKDLLDLVQMHMLRINSQDRLRAKALDSRLKQMLQRAQADPVYLLDNIPPDPEIISSLDSAI